MLYRNRAVIFAVWVLPGRTETGDVSGADSDFSGHQSGSCLYIVCYPTDRCYRDMGFRTNRLAVSGYGRGYLLLDAVPGEE